MTKKRFGKIYKEDLEILKRYVAESNTYKEVLEKLGLSHRGHSYTVLKERLVLENIDVDHFHKTVTKTVYVSYMDYLTSASPCNSSSKLKSILINYKLKKYECSECGIGPNYNGKPLTIQLDHINGISNDNRLENLRFLCPNCHTQTDTYSGKNAKRGPLVVSTDLKQQIYNVDKTIKNKKPRPRKFEITASELKELLLKFSLTAIGKLYSVSGNAVKKRCGVLGISLLKGRIV